MASIKIAAVLLKSLCKPISKVLKDKSQDPGRLRSMFDQIGQFNHIIATRVQARAKGIRLSSIKPLVEDEAVKTGAEFFSEFLVIFVGISTVSLELTRKHFADQKANEAKRAQEIEHKKYKEEMVVQKELALQRRLIDLEAKVLDMENAKLELLHDKLVRDQVQHLLLTEQLIAHNEMIESYLGERYTQYRRANEFQQAQRAHERIKEILPGALPHNIRHLGEESVLKDAADVDDPSYREKALAVHKATEQVVDQKIQKDKEQEKKEKIAAGGEKLGAKQRMQEKLDRLLTSSTMTSGGEDLSVSSGPIDADIISSLAPVEGYDQRKPIPSHEKTNQRGLIADIQTQIQHLSKEVAQLTAKKAALEAEEERKQDEAKNMILVPFNAVPLLVPETQQNVENRFTYGDIPVEFINQDAKVLGEIHVGPSAYNQALDIRQILDNSKATRSLIGDSTIQKYTPSYIQQQHAALAQSQSRD